MPTVYAAHITPPKIIAAVLPPESGTMQLTIVTPGVYAAICPLCSSKKGGELSCHKQHTDPSLQINLADCPYKAHFHTMGNNLSEQKIALHRE